MAAGEGHQLVGPLTPIPALLRQMGVDPSLPVLAQAGLAADALQPPSQWRARALASAGGA